MASGDCSTRCRNRILLSCGPFRDFIRSCWAQENCARRFEMPHSWSWCKQPAAIAGRWNTDTGIPTHPTFPKSQSSLLGFWSTALLKQEENGTFQTVATFPKRPLCDWYWGKTHMEYFFSRNANLFFTYHWVTAIFLSGKHSDSHSSWSSLLITQWEAQGSSPDVQFPALSVESGLFLFLIFSEWPDQNKGCLAWALWARVPRKKLCLHLNLRRDWELMRTVQRL